MSRAFLFDRKGNCSSGASFIQRTQQWSTDPSRTLNIITLTCVQHVVTGLSVDANSLLPGVLCAIHNLRIHSSNVQPTGPLSTLKVPTLTFVQIALIPLPAVVDLLLPNALVAPHHLRIHRSTVHSTVIIN